MDTSVQIALYQPDIPQNTGAILRTCACLAIPVHIIEPCGFMMSDKNLRRAGMDYLASAQMIRHASWARFVQDFPGERLVLATTRGTDTLPSFEFVRGDVLLFGRESAGAPEEVHARADRRLRLPIKAETRSLNLAASVAMLGFEALRQLDALPRSEP